MARRFNKKLYFTMTFTLIFFVAVAFGGVWAYQFLAKPQMENKSIAETTLDSPKTETGKIGVLLLGTDEGGLRTDTIIYLSYDLDNNIINTVSIPRDTRVEVDGHKRKINAAHAVGGTDLLINVVKDTFNIPINYYCEVELTGFIEIVDILGGLDFDVPQDMKKSDPSQGLDIDLKKGMQHLDGKGVHDLVRFRDYPEADIQRTRVQQAALKAMVGQHLTMNNLLKANDLFGSMSKCMTTNMTMLDMLKYLPNVKEFNSENLVNHQLPGEPKYIGGVSYVIYDSVGCADMFSDEFGIQ